MMQMNISTKQTQARRHRKQTYNYGEKGVDGEINKEFGISRYKPLYTK